MSFINPEKMDKCVDEAMPKIMNILWNTMLQNKLVNQDDANTLTSHQGHEENLENKREIIMKIKEIGQYAANSLLDRFSSTDDGKIHRMIKEAGDFDPDDDSDNSPWDATGPLRVKVKQTAESNIIPKQLLRSNPRGLVLSITITDYNDLKNNRKSAEYDSKNVKKLFRKLGFKVITRTNISVGKFRKLLKKWSKDSLLDTVDSLCVVISAHGGYSNDENVIDLVNGQMTYSELVNYFSDQNCPAMAGKPKLFIDQACRGEIKRYDDPLKGLNVGTLKSRYVKVKGKPVPSFSNIYIVHSTLPNHPSYRNIDYGSYFIQTLCDVFQKYACRYSIQDLMLLISERLNKKRFGDRSNIQAPTVKTIRVFKKLYLNPPRIKKHEWEI